MSSGDRGVNAKVASLLYQGFQMVATDRQIYFSMDGGSSYEQPSNCVYSIKTQTPDIVDISLKHFYITQPHRFDIDIHYVLRRGNTGLYVYVVSRQRQPGIGRRPHWSL
jgi:rhamnogalacturonan endolyase